MVRAVEETIQECLRIFARTLTENFAAQVAAQSEDQLKPPLKALLETAGPALGFPPVVVRTETPLPGIGRPDAGVTIRRLLCGHVELKPPGTGARPERFRGHDREQWRRFQALPNLLYTDGNEWALYRTGERAGAVVRFSGDVTVDGEDAVTPEQASRFADLLRLFLAWEPITPRTPKALAKMLAPLCRMLRETVHDALQHEDSRLRQLAADWRRLLFPLADDRRFADAYAQTLTYALLLAHFEGATDPRTAAATLDSGHGLLAQALRVLADPQAKPEIEAPVETLERAIFAVDVNALRQTDRELWLYFYEDFLGAYDAKLRKDSGVYYTPVEVVNAQVTLVAQLLRERFDKPLAFADDNVVFLDPAVGTGTYPLAAVQHGLDLVRWQEGEGAVSGRATVLGNNMHAFELLVGPYAVAHLRLTRDLLDAGGDLPPEGAHVYLTDTLESPHREPPGQQTLGLFHRPLAEEHRRAQQVKADTRVLVCMGNPPYDREQRDPDDDPDALRKGGWVRHGDDEHGIHPILEKFLAPARDAGRGVHLKNLYNDYVYFWRWALWKVFENTEEKGIVSFITASSYLRGPGFVGMRQVMRQTFDELWIIDLEGGDVGARRTENVFAIQTPVAIAVGVRFGPPNPETPATVCYTKFSGTRDEKLSALNGVSGFASLTWRNCYDGWQEPFLPVGEGDYFNWPLLTAMFPWQHSGLEFKRTWPLAATREILTSRWETLLSQPRHGQRTYFRETGDRRIDRQYPSLDDPSNPLPALVTLPSGTPPLRIERSGFRSFDRQWVLADPRLASRIRPALWLCHGEHQVFLTSLLTGVLGLGPAAVVTHLIPDRHHFRGSFGGKDIIPLWRDVAATQPNVTAGVLDRLVETYGVPVMAEDLFAYVYALFSTPDYAERFSEELTEPGPRIPLTREIALFQQGVALGRRLVWLHTYGERWAPEGERVGAVPQGRARCTAGVPEQPQAYPENFEYEEATQTLRVGEGAFAPVTPEVWTFSVSGLQVVRSWLAYRMKDGAGRTSSPLDEIRPERWTAQLTEELLHLLWVLEATIDLFPTLADNLRAVLDGPLFIAADLPEPTNAERRAPTAESPHAEQTSMTLDGEET